MRIISSLDADIKKRTLCTLLNGRHWRNKGSWDSLRHFQEIRLVTTFWMLSYALGTKGIRPARNEGAAWVALGSLGEPERVHLFVRVLHLLITFKSINYEQKRQANAWWRWASPRRYLDPTRVIERTGRPVYCKLEKDKQIPIRMLVLMS